MLPNPRLTLTAFSKFEAGVEKLLRRNGIKTAPKLLIEDATDLSGKVPASYQMALMGEKKDPVGTIQIAAGLAAKGETPVTMGIYGHEAGHALADHSIGQFLGLFMVDGKRAEHEIPIAKLADLAEMKPIHKLKKGFRLIGEIINDQRALTKGYKRQEHEADRLMTHLLGSKEKALSARRMASPGSEIFEDAMGTLNKPVYNPAAFVRRVMGKRAFTQAYGTPTELENNIRSVNLKDRAWVERLIEEREQRIEAEIKP